MLIHKGLVELMGYSATLGDLTVVPVRIDADDYTFEAEFQVINKDGKQVTFCRRGKHKDFVLTTSIQNIPFTINSDGVIKRLRVKK